METGIDMISYCQLVLGETKSTAAQLQSQLWPIHMRDSASFIAKKAHNLYLSARHDIIDGQVEYCLPYSPFEIRAVNVVSATGNIYPLASIRPEDMDDGYYLWRNNPAAWTGTPMYFVTEGADRYKLYPTPNYFAQNGLNIEGYFDCKFWQMPDCSPLPSHCDEGIKMGAIYRRCREMASNPDYAQKLKLFENDYEAQKNLAVRISTEHDEAHRNGGPPSMGKSLGAWGGGWTAWGW